MESNDILREYFCKLENTKRLEDGPYPEMEELLNRVKDTEIWKQFIKSSFDVTDNELQDYLKSPSTEIRSKIFKFGISCLVYFIQANFTGPHLSEDIVKVLENPEYEKIDFVKLLAVNHEEINENAKYPVLLFVSKTIFERCFIANLINSLWNCRSIMIHQLVMDEMSSYLLSQAEALLKHIDTLNLHGHDKAKCDIEFAQLYLTFKYATKAIRHLYSAVDILGVTYNLEGKVGKKTKRRGKNEQILTLEITLAELEGIQRPLVHLFDVPKNFTVKEELKFIKDRSKRTILPNTEQKFFLTRAQEIILAKPKDDLENEDLEAFIDVILSNKNTWSVRVATLLFRCRLEVLAKKNLDRALAQCKEILASYNKPKPHVLNRVADVFGTGLLPMWRVEAQCADVLVCMGLLKEALDIYTKIKSWEDVIDCYTLMKMKHRAAEIINEQLSVETTVKMWCLLGDATDDVTCYEKAWELSRKRSHRAQRHWANYLYARKEYQECIPHFEKSASINPLQCDVWLRLGHAGARTDNWHIAATAYRRYINMRPDGPEGWNRLAEAFTRIGNKDSAHGSFYEALKYDYDNTLTWENYLNVSCDIKRLSDVIEAYHKLLDLLGKYWNSGALHVLVVSVCADFIEEKKRPGLRRKEDTENLVKKTRELIGRVITIYPGEGCIWEMFACLVPPSILRVQRLQRAFKGYTQPGWDKNPQNCVQVMCLCLKLSELVLTKSIEAQSVLLNSVKLNLSTAIAAIKKHDWSDTKALVEEVSAHLELLAEKVKKMSERHTVCSDKTII